MNGSKRPRIQFSKMNGSNSMHLRKHVRIQCHVLTLALAAKVSTMLVFLYITKICISYRYMMGKYTGFLTKNNCFIFFNKKIKRW
jgi:hypothetical protein